MGISVFSTNLRHFYQGDKRGSNRIYQLRGEPTPKWHEQTDIGDYIYKLIENEAPDLAGKGISDFTYDDIEFIKSLIPKGNVSLAIDVSRFLKTMFEYYFNIGKTDFFPHPLIAREQTRKEAETIKNITVKYHNVSFDKSVSGLFPNVLTIYTGESLFSYYNRLSRANAFFDFQSFKQKVLLMNAPSSNLSDRDNTFIHPAFWSILKIDGYDPLNQGTVYGMIKSFLTPLQQTRFLNGDFAEKSKFTNIETRYVAIFRQKMCPTCMRSDYRSGIEPYGRTIHQIPYLTICPMHLCSLVSYSQAMPLIQKDLRIKEIYDFDENDKKYARFWMSMYKNTPGGNAIDLRNIIINTIRKRCHDKKIDKTDNDTVISWMYNNDKELKYFKHSALKNFLYDRYSIPDPISISFFLIHNYLHISHQLAFLLIFRLLLFLFS